MLETTEPSIYAVSKPKRNSSISVRQVQIQFGHSFRGVEGRRRIGRETAVVLSQQHPVAGERAGTDARKGRPQHRFLIVVHRVRATRSAARDRADPASTGHIALREYQADMRGYPARHDGGVRGAVRHRAALFQPDRGASVGVDRGASERGSWQPRSVYYADGGRDSAVPEYFRGRLRYVGRFGCPGLYRRGRPGPRACGGGRPDGRRQEPVELRVFQRGHRSGAFGDRTGRNV